MHHDKKHAETHRNDEPATAAPKQPPPVEWPDDEMHESMGQEEAIQKVEDHDDDATDSKPRH